MIKIMETRANQKPEANTRGVRSTLTELVLVPTDEQEDSEN